MINNDRKFKTATKTVYDEPETLDYEMDSARNAYTREDLYENDARRESVARDSAQGFEELLNSQEEVKNKDVYPSETTMEYKGRRFIYEDYHNEEDAVENEDKAEYRVNTKGKVLITVYALVVLTIFTLIILNTRLLKNMNNSLSQQEAKVAAMQERAEQLAEEYKFVSSDEEVIRRAEEMGMVKAD